MSFISVVAGMMVDLGLLVRGRQKTLAALNVVGVVGVPYLSEITQLLLDVILHLNTHLPTLCGHRERKSPFSQSVCVWIVEEAYIHPFSDHTAKQTLAAPKYTEQQLPPAYTTSLPHSHTHTTATATHTFLVRT